MGAYSYNGLTVVKTKNPGISIVSVYIFTLFIVQKPKKFAFRAWRLGFEVWQTICGDVHREKFEFSLV